MTGEHTSKPAHGTEEQQFSPEDLAHIDKRTAELKSEDLRRYERVMAEIDKDEAEAMERLRQIRIRRAIVKRTGHHG
jgi:hypothetical protein